MLYYLFIMLYYLIILLLSPYVAWQDAPEAWQMGFQDPATPVMQGIIDLHDDFFLLYSMIEVLIPDISIVIEWLGLLVLPVVLFLMMPQAEPMELPPLGVNVYAYKYYWVYEIIENINGIAYKKTVYSLPQEHDLEQVVHRLVVPHGRRINVLVTAMEYVQCRWRVRSLGFDFLATFGNFTEGQVRIRHGLHRALPVSRAGYPLPTDPRRVMAIEVEGAFGPAFYDWFLSSQGELSNAAVPFQNF